jgi:pSer/pThr/pTyr-binding forkhead associated (FHA) protein
MMAPGEELVASMRPPAGGHVTLVLEPVSHPELDDIHIDESLFAIGRTEAPFDTYAAAIVADLSRRHARIFVEGGAAYLADLDSKNGTTVNGVPLRSAIARLRDGDELGFGRALAYRLRLQAGTEAPRRVAKLVSLTLSPERADAGLEPIVITRFPFLISKVDETFARYKDACPHQLNYLSRRHAHIFLKAGRPYVEDLGSTNGTFAGVTRLDEHALALKDGDVLAFGGHHFVYRVTLRWEEAAVEPTVTRQAVAANRAGAGESADADKTTFVAAADSFLDIFCVDQPRSRDGEPVDAAPAAPGAGGRPRGKLATFVSGLASAFFGGEAGSRTGLRRTVALAALAATLLLVLVFALFRSGAPERELARLLANGNYARAAVLASDRLARDPNNVELKALGTEALLKARVPAWLALLDARQYEQASNVVADMRAQSSHNAELQLLVGELESIGKLEEFVSARGGAGAPVNGAADAAQIELIVKQWQDEKEAHQRAFATISSYVPAFRDAYAQALSHVRKLALSGGRVENDRQ